MIFIRHIRNNGVARTDSVHSKHLFPVARAHINQDILDPQTVVRLLLRC